MFDILSLKKQSPEKALEIVQKAEATLADEQMKQALIKAQMDEISIAAGMRSLANGEPMPDPEYPQELLDAFNAQSRRVPMAEVMVNTARAQHEAVLAREAEKREAERKKKVAAVINNIRQAGEALDSAINNMAEATKAFRRSQEQALGVCSEATLDKFKAANLAIIQVLARKLDGAAPGIRDNRILNDQSSASVVQKLPKAD